MMAVSCGKAMLVILFFMHLKWDNPSYRGLFFIGATMDRLIRAYDASDGSEVWHHQLPVDATATPMSYVHEGRQYIVINAGGHAMFSRGTGDYLYAFALPEEAL